MLAAYKGHTECVKILIDQKANLDLKDFRGETALMMASELGKTECVKILINQKANLNL